jgi:hypothetical protein
MATTTTPTLEEEVTLLVAEVRRAVEDFRTRLAQQTPGDSEDAPAGSSTFTEIAGPAFDENVYRIEVRGPVDETSNVVLRKGAKTAPLTIQKTVGSVIRGEIALDNPKLDDGTWEAVFVHGGTEHVIGRTELEA